MNQRLFWAATVLLTANLMMPKICYAAESSLNSFPDSASVEKLKLTDRTTQAVTVLRTTLNYECQHLSIPMGGLASWYGFKDNGKDTASGKNFNENELTAAHRSLPFGTKVLVTNLENGRSVIVRITDRGPYIEGRIIDLSTAAAKALGMIQPGVVPVQVDVLQETKPLWHY